MNTFYIFKTGGGGGVNTPLACVSRRFFLTLQSIPVIQKQPVFVVVVLFCFIFILYNPNK